MLSIKVLGLIVTSQTNLTRWPCASYPGCCWREHGRKIASIFRCNFHLHQGRSYTSISPSLALHSHGGVKLRRLLYSSATLGDRVSSQIFIGRHCHTAVSAATAQTHINWSIWACLSITTLMRSHNTAIKYTLHSSLQRVCRTKSVYRMLVGLAEIIRDRTQSERKWI